MKRTQPKKRSSAKKGSAPRSVEQYIEAIPESARPNFNKLRAAVRAAVPADVVEVISYNIPALKRDRVLVWYAAFAKHCSLFPTASVIDAFSDELKGFSTSKGTIKFSNEKPIPIALVKRIVKARVAESGE